MTSIWWIRRDIRLHDNPTLEASLKTGSCLPVFVIEPKMIEGAPRRKLGFMFNSLKKLDEELKKAGSYLVIRKGPAQVALQQLMSEINIEKIYAEEDFSPYSRKRDRKISERLPLELIQGQLISPPGAILNLKKEPYKIYTPYKNAWLSLLPNPMPYGQAPKSIQTPPGISSAQIPDFSEEIHFPAGELEGLKRLNAFIASDGAIYKYGKYRDRMDTDGTSQLSPYFHFGLIGQRRALNAAQIAKDSSPNLSAQESVDIWISELIWREFYAYILYHYPRVTNASFRVKYDSLKWQNNKEDFNAWKNGLTGYPIVDAGMRQLKRTGWMHNRARMITASFLVKHLLIDWRWGESWFMENLIDGDVAANNGGWQWIAGTGTDAAPYFRIFNPELQGKKFDPNGDYVRKWIPELAKLHKKAIHSPWNSPQTILDYPAPIVDHKFARERALTAYSIFS